MRANPVKRALKPLAPYRARIAYRNLQTRIINWNLKTPDALPQDVRWRLMESFQQDIATVERLTGHDLSAWTQ